jgi:hypothetical protein
MCPNSMVLSSCVEGKNPLSPGKEQILTNEMQKVKKKLTEENKPTPNIEEGSYPINQDARSTNHGICSA